MSYCHPRYATSSAYSSAGPGGPGAGFDHPFAHRFGPPFVLKALAVVGAVALFPPLGVAALAYLAWRGVSHGGWACRSDGEGAGARWRRFSESGPGWRIHSSGNSAFDDHRAETLKALAEEAEAYAEFERRQRQARDREAFERFQADRAAKPANNSDKPGEPGAPAA